MKLSTLLKDVDYVVKQGNDELEIEHLVYNSKKVLPNSVFVSMNGELVNGDAYIQEAINKGAIAIVSENENLNFKDITIICVKNIRNVLACMSCTFFDYPAKSIRTIGITGTKGKTTSAMMVYHMLLSCHQKVGYIGTNGAYINQKHFETANTTPESYEVQSLFRQMVDAGCKYVVMEVSSIGILRHRLDGFNFDIGCFTNLSNDHIGPNEHATFEEYLNCKAELFKRSKLSIINEDDDYASVMKEASCDSILPISLRYIGLNEISDVDYVSDDNYLGMHFSYKNQYFKIPLPGLFNVSNAILAVSIGECLNLSLKDMADALVNVNIQGRSEVVPTYPNVKVIIDYAHNAISMEKIVVMAKHYHPKRLITLFGCGGNRAKSRRFEMGKVSGTYADLSIITSDNSRFEKTSDIIQDIITGLAPTNGKYVAIENRQEAIEYALKNAMPGDMILILGKGHEMYQEINGEKFEFNERQIILDYVNKA